MISLASLRSRIEDCRVVQIFDVFYMLAEDYPQYVILLEDGSFLCTCLLLQNTGIVCRHFFHLMVEDKRCKYHISLIPKRWYKETQQDVVTSDEPFIFAETQQRNLDDTDYVPMPDTYMAQIRTAFPIPSSSTAGDLVSSTKKRKYGELIGLSRQIAEAASENPEEYERVRGILQQQLLRMKGNDEVNDPQYVKAKGRPRNKRLKNAMEKNKKNRITCGKCGDSGHNVRTCTM